MIARFEASEAKTSRSRSLEGFRTAASLRCKLRPLLPFCPQAVLCLLDLLDLPPRRLTYSEMANPKVIGTPCCPWVRPTISTSAVFELGQSILGELTPCRAGGLIHRIAQLQGPGSVENVDRCGGQVNKGRTSYTDLPLNAVHQCPHYAG